MRGYSERAPRRALADFVHCVWTYAADSDIAPQPIVPDGRCELILHLRKPYLELRGRRTYVQPPVLFAGQLTKPLTLIAQADVSVVGVRFRPEAARAFLGIDADAATDKRLDLAAVHGEAAWRMRREAWEQSFAHAPELVEDYVEQRVAGARIDGDVRRACEALLAGAEAVAPDALSERQWQRRFKREVGVSARMLASIVRFRRVFDAVDADHTWVAAALSAGYFDQPQLARDFRRFLGRTAREWAVQRAGLATALAAPETYKTAPAGPR